MVSPAFETWRRQGQRFEHRGHAIAVVERGRGEAMLAIHGFPSASWDWHAILPGLTPRFRVIAPDLLGFGWSDKPRSFRYSMLDQADRLEALLAARGVDRVHLLAHDYGDTVAQELLARHEQRAGRGLAIASCVLLNGGLFPECHHPRPVQRLLATRLGPLVARLSSRRTLARGLHAIFGRDTPPSPAFVDELWTMLRHADGQLALPRLIDYIRERKQHRARWVGALERTRVPLVLIDGAADPVSGADMIARWRELLPQAQLVVLPGIGHYPQIEAPDAVLAAMLRFHDRLRDST
ncbi:MAG: alpha/beta hydrolase [Nannocystaceae bacterium]|nr:alpha/beta hydrolase [Nannocystaceae bacterium]